MNTPRSLAQVCAGKEVLNGHTDWGPAPGQSVFTYNFQCKSSGKD